MEGVTVPFFFDLFECFPCGIRGEDGSNQKAENQETDHNRGGTGKMAILIDLGKDDIPNSEDQAGCEKGDPLCKSTVSGWKELTIPELIKRLLTGAIVDSEQNDESYQDADVEDFFVAGVR